MRRVVNDTRRPRSRRLPTPEPVPSAPPIPAGRNGHGVVARGRATLYGSPSAAPAADLSPALLAALEHAGEGVFLLDREWRVLHRGAAAVCLTDGGAAFDGAVPTLWQAWPSLVGSEAERAMRAAMADRASARLEHRGAADDGGDRWLDILVSPTADGLCLILRDVGAQKRAEDAARRADTRFDLVAGAVEAALFDWDLETGEVTRSRGLSELLGYDPSEADATKEWWLDLVHPDDRDRVAADLGAALAAGDGYVTLCRARHKDGGYRHVRDRGLVVRDAAGRATRVVGSTVDVTARRETEAALAASEERRRLALRHAPVVVYQQDRDLRFTWVDNLNPLAWPDGVVGRTDADLLPPAEAAVVLPLKRRVMETGEAARKEVRATSPTGTRVYDLTVEPLRDERGAVVGVTGSAVDVTERWRAEEELRRRADLLDQADDAIFAWDWPNGTITFWNRGAERLYGLPRGEALGRISHDLLRTRHADTTARFLDDLERDGSWSGELEHVAADGATMTVETRHALVREPNGSAFVVEVNRDVTARRALERLHEDFLAAASHDLKNPLGAVKGQAQLLRRRLLRGGAPDVDRLVAGLEQIDATTGRMTALIDELGDIARLRAGQPLDLRLEPIDMVALVRQCAEQYGRTTDRHCLRVETPLPHLIGIWDERRLERVIANLVTNAIKYSPSGGEVLLCVDLEEGANGPWVVVAVRDRGVGIPAADLPHVFDRFRRGANVGGIAGTGIGLAGARRIVEQHGGTILVASIEGEGSTFTMRIPLNSAEA